MQKKGQQKSPAKEKKNAEERMREIAENKKREKPLQEQFKDSIEEAEEKTEAVMAKMTNDKNNDQSGSQNTEEPVINQNSNYQPQSVARNKNSNLQRSNSYYTKHNIVESEVTKNKIKELEKQKETLENKVKELEKEKSQKNSGVTYTDEEVKKIRNEVKEKAYGDANSNLDIFKESQKELAKANEAILLETLMQSIKLIGGFNEKNFEKKDPNWKENSSLLSGYFGSQIKEIKKRDQGSYMHLVMENGKKGETLEDFEKELKNKEEKISSLEKDLKKNLDKNQSEKELFNKEKQSLTKEKDEAVFNLSLVERKLEDLTEKFEETRKIFNEKLSQIEKFSSNFNFSENQYFSEEEDSEEYEDEYEDGETNNLTENK